MLRKVKISIKLLMIGLLLSGLSACEKSEEKTISSSPTFEQIPNPLATSSVLKPPIPLSHQSSSISASVTPSITPTPRVTPSVISSAQKVDSTTILKELLKNRISVSLCENDVSVDYNLSRDSATVFELNHNQYLVAFPCFLGAYQGLYEYYSYQKVGNKSQFKLMLLDTYERNNASNQYIKKTVRSIGGLPDYNSEKEELMIFTKYRGLGDCGAVLRYHWTGTNLILISFQEKPDCDGNYLDIEQYPQIYP